jgi:hypothetical protein
MPDEVTPPTMPIPDSPLQAVAAWLRKIEWPLALLVVIVIVGVAAPFWNVPLSRDQGVYATCADVLLSGGVPYRDCWDTKGPMLHYTYALAKLIFGVNSSGPYILNALAIAATALILAALAYRWIGRLRLAYAVGLLYGLLAIIVRFDMNAQPESFANFFTMLGLLGITIGTQKGRRWLFPASGVVLALAVLYKYALLLPFGVAALALVFGVPLSAPQKPLRKRLENFGLTLAGSLGVVLIFGLYLLLVGALDDALLHVRFILFYFPRAQLNPDEYAIRSLPLQQTLLYFGRLPVVFGLAFVGCAAAVWRRRWYGLPLILYVLAGVAVVWGQQRFTPYHWTASLPALSLAIGALAYEILNFPPLSAPAQNAILGVMAAGLAVNVGTFFYVDQWLILGDYLTGREDAETFFETQGVWDQMVAADYIRERTDPDDPIWVWGHHTAIYYLAQRHSPTRFIYNEPLLMHIRGGHPWKEAWRAEALEDIYRDPPVYILLTTFDRTFFDFQNPNDSWRDIPEYSGFTARYYLKEYEFGRFQYYRLKPYWSRQNDPDLLDAVTVADLIARFDEAAVEQQSEPPIAVTPFEVPGEPGYDTLLMQPDARLSYTLDLPPGPVCLRVDTVMFPDSWTWEGDGATFTLEVEHDGEVARLLEEYLANEPSNQHWHPHLIDLSAYGGQTVRLTFQTGPGPAGDYVGDWAGWGMPRLVRPPSGEVCDTNAVVDLR